MTDALPLATVVVPSWNGAHLLRACLTSLEAQSYPSLEVIVADGGSVDDSEKVVRGEFPTVRFHQVGRNLGFTGNANAGLRTAQGNVLLLLNNDAQAEPEWVRASVETLLANPRVGSVAAKMLFADGVTINSAGDGVSRAGWPFQRGAGRRDGPEWSQGMEVFGASGGAVAYRRAMLRDVGLFDEDFFMYLEDVDLAFRAQLRGWRCLFEPEARVRHLGSATGGGPLASFYNGRNLIRLLVKNLPSSLILPLLPAVLGAQIRRAEDAVSAWQGTAARATLRGQVAGLARLPQHLAARRAVQSRRAVPDGYILSLLTDPHDDVSR